MQQIEQLGQVLAQMLAYLLGIKGAGSAGLSLDEIRQNYNDGLNLHRHLEKMGDILSETGDLYEKTGDSDTSRNLRGKALIIYTHLQDTSKAFSMERMQKISRLRDKG